MSWKERVSWFGVWMLLAHLFCYWQRDTVPSVYWWTLPQWSHKAWTAVCVIMGTRWLFGTDAHK